MKRECRWSPRQIEKYRQRISGPLLDRIDLHVEVPLVDFREVASDTNHGEKSETIRQRVVNARDVQMERFKKFSNSTNSAIASPKGLRAAQVVSVSSNNVALIEKVSRDITTLLEQGIAVESNEPSYYYMRLGELKLEMLAEAAKDARARAEKILNSAGNTSVGKLVDADMGIININAANSTQTSTEGNNDTSSRDKDIITIIHAEYEVN